MHTTTGFWQLALIGCLLAATPAAAQEQEQDGSLGFANSTEFSAVATYGNAETATLGLNNVLTYRWPVARFTARFEALRSTEAAARFVEVTPGEGGLLEGFTLEFKDPDRTLAVERYLVEAVYDRELSGRLFWNVGASWDRNGEAGIVSRYVAFTGLGTRWFDRDDLHFESTYGISYTDRQEEDPDPAKDDDFIGARAAYTYWNKWGAATTFRNNARFNINVNDASDWSADMRTAVEVALNRRLSLQVGVRLSYNHLPALESIEVLAILPGEVQIDFGSVRLPKEKLDTILTSALVLNF